MRLRRGQDDGLGERLKRAAAAGPHLGAAVRQPGEEADHVLLHGGLGAQAGVGSDLRARPGPEWGCPDTTALAQIPCCAQASNQAARRKRCLRVSIL